MADITFELNTAGVGELLKSAEMLSLVDSYGAQYVSGMGEGYDYKTFIGHDRAHAYVFPTTEKAKKDNLEYNTLLKGAGMND